MEPSKLPRDSERRYATVLFADISGFTSMSEKLDPEEVTDIINQCFSLLAAVVTDHGGHIDKYIGDCIMALFGVPTALEHAPQQSINAAIEMRSRLTRLVAERQVPVALDIHIGINTGLVIAGNVGGEAKQEFTVVGDAVNLASRLKDLAPLKAIYVGAETYRYARDEFEFRKLAPLAVKGKERPVEAYELLSDRSRTHRPKPAVADRAISSPLVGRDGDLRLLRACIAAAARGEGGIVNLIAEAGLGKSRLLAEACAAEETASVLVLEGRSVSVGQNLRYHPFIDLLRHWADIAEDGDESEATAKLEAAVTALCADDAGDVFPFVATLMGFRPAGAHAERLRGITGESLEKLVVKSVRDLLQRLAATKPLMLVFEDLHWADQSSIGLLEALLRLAHTEPILFVHAFRPDHPESSERILAVSREQHGARQIEIALEAFDEQHCQDLIRNLLKSPDLPYATVALIARTAEGNPFYIEEVVRSLIDEGVIEQTKGRLTVTERIDSVVIPDTIQGVIMARVDRLPRPTRHVLQVASVLGRSFYYRILARVIPDGVDLDAELAQLKERQLLLERRTRRTSTVARRMLTEEVEYVFKHALAQETIYESILQKTRKELHRQVADAIEAVFADRVADFYGMLAYHYSRAEQLEKAEEYLFRAGDEAARAAASSEALIFFREASRLYFQINGTGGDPKKKALLEKNIALALLNKGQLTESIDHFDRALEHLGEPVPTGKAAIAWRFAVDVAAVLPQLYRGLSARGRARNLDHEREVCELFFYRGRAEVTSDPRRLFRELFTGLRRFNGIDPAKIDQACTMYVSMAALFAYSGISFAVSHRMLGIAGTLLKRDNVPELFIYREALFAYHYLRGDWSDEHAIEDALVEQNLRYGQVWDVNNYLGLDCDRRLRQGDFAAARTILDTLDEISNAYGFAFAGTNRDGMRAVLLLEERRLDLALREALRYCAARHEDALRVFALGLVAKAQILLGDRDAASVALVKAEEIVRSSGVVSPWHQSGYLLARLLFDVTALEAADGVGRPPRALVRRARRSARRAIRISRIVAKERTETLQLVGRLWWAVGHARHAVAAWQQSVLEGQRLGARVELGRTYLEAGRRLAGSSSAPRALGDLDGAACVREAERLFAAIGLDDHTAVDAGVALPSAAPA